MYNLFAAGIGSMIAVMVMLNGVFAMEVGQSLSILIIHLVGLVAVSLLCLFIKEGRRAETVPVYLYAGGIVSVLLTFSNNLCFQQLGASLTLCLGMLGQSMGSILTDITGFLGMNRYAFDKRKIVGFCVAFVGILLMVEEWEAGPLFAVLALATGLLVILTMVLNTRLSHYLGVFRATKVNFIVALVLSVGFLAFFKEKPMSGFWEMREVNVIYWSGGGILGVFIVAGINHALPKIPTIYSTLFIFLGQISTGLVVDCFLLDLFSLRRLLGAGVVFTGLVINLAFDRFSSIPGEKSSPVSKSIS